MRQKILFISHDATRTGAPIVFLHLLHWFRENTDVPFQILLKDGGPLEEAFREIGPTHTLNWNNHSFDQAAKIKYLTDLATQNFDLIYSNTIANGEVLEALAAADCPIISHVHELEYRIRHQTKPEIFAGVANCTDHYFAAAQAVKRNLIENHGIPKEIIDVVYEFVPTHISPSDLKICQKIRQNLGIPPNSLIVGACGTSDWRKGPDLFIQLASMVRRAIGDSVHFCWIGAQVESRDFSALAYDLEKTDLDRNVHFVGPKPNPQDYFSLFDVFVSVSREDPYPLVNLEAAAHGTPVICFDNSGGAREFVEKDCGYVVAYLDLVDMCSRVTELLKTPELRRRMGDEAQKKVRHNHDISITAPEILQRIETVTSRWTPGANKVRMRRLSALKNPHNNLHDLFEILLDPMHNQEMLKTSFHRIGKGLQEVNFYNNLYNLASWLELKMEKSKAHTLFATISRFAADSNPDLAGKAFFKMGCLAASDAEAVQSFRHCLEIYPAHQAARQRLWELTDGSDNKIISNNMTSVYSPVPAARYTNEIQG